jgi:hypothetical protein
MRQSPIPESGVFARFVLEEPWLLATAAGLVGVGLLYLALGRDEQRFLKAGVGCLAVAGLVLGLGSLIQTTAEEVRDETVAFVLAAEDGRIQDMIATLAPDATIHFGRPENPGQPIDQLERDLRTLGRQHRITANSMTDLIYGAFDDDSAMTAFSCRTTTESSYGPVRSAWVIEWSRDSGGTWRVQRLTAVKIGGQIPRGSVFR